MTRINPNEGINYFHNSGISRDDARKFIDKAFNDLVANQRDFSWATYVDCVNQLNKLRELVETLPESELAALVQQATDLSLGKLPSGKTDPQKEAQKILDDATKAIKEFLDLIGSSLDQINQKKGQIQALKDLLQKCKEALEKLSQNPDSKELQERHKELLGQLNQINGELAELESELKELQNEHSLLETELNQFMEDLKRAKQNIDTLPKEEQEKALEELKNLYEDFQGKLKESSDQIQEKKLAFDEKQKEINLRLDNLSKEITDFSKEIPGITPPPPEKDPTLPPDMPPAPTGRETPQEIKDKIEKYFQYLADNWIKLGMSPEEYKEAVATIQRIRGAATQSPADLQLIFDLIKPMTDEAKEAKKIFDEIKKIMDAIAAMKNQCKDLESLIASLLEKLKSCDGKGNPTEYARLNEALLAAKQKLASLTALINSAAPELSVLFGLLEALKKAISKETDATERKDLLEQLKEGIAEFLALSKFDPAQLQNQLTDLLDELSDIKLEIRELRKELGLLPPFDDSVGQDFYFDFGVFQNDIQSIINACGPDTPGFAERFKAKFATYLKDLFSRLSEAGINKLFLSFGQLSTIPYLMGMTDTPPSQSDIDRDTILQIFQLSEKIGLDRSEIFKMFVDTAKENGFEINLSIGGERATTDNFSIPPGQAKAIAEATARFMKEFGIISIDIDIEGQPVEAIKKNPKGFQDYFRELNRLLKAEGAGREIFLTPVADWTHAQYNAPPAAPSPLQALFYDENGKSIFKELFSGLKLMTYSASQYYLDADHHTWGIKQWIDLVGGPEYAHLISVGFEDNIPYEKGPANANPDNGYVIQPGSTPGEGAAQVFLQLVAELMKIGYLSKDAEAPTYGLGKSFGWPDIANAEKTYHGVNDFMKDFEDYLRDNSPADYF